MFLPTLTSPRSPSTLPAVAELTPGHPEFLTNIRRVLPAPDGIYLGKRVGDGKDVSLPLVRTMKNVALEGMTGAGKTTLAQEIDFVAPFDDMAIIALDFIGTGFLAAQTHKAFLGTLLFNIEREYPEILRGVTPWFLRRFAFATLSTRGGNVIHIDILKRRERPGGALEDVQEVTDRVLNVFSVRFETDMNFRVRFRRVARVILALLCAAGRSICEYSKLLDRRNDTYLAFIQREIEASGTAADEFVRRQMEKLLELRALPPSAYDTMTESFRNSMDDYDVGTPLGTFFGSDETYDPAFATLGNGRFYVTTDLPNETLRREAFLALHAIHTAQFALRRPGTGDYNLLHYVLDEADKWVPQSILTHVAQGRNLGISTWLLFQNIAQWRRTGIPEMADVRESICGLNAVWRPTSFDQAKELALRTHPINPMGALHRLLTNSRSTSRTDSESVTDTWQDAISASSGFSDDSGMSFGESMTMIDDAPRLTLNSSDSRRSGHSTSDGWSMAYGGSRGTSVAKMVGDAISETIIRIPFGEQLDVAAQQLLRRPDYQATWMHGGKAVEVDMAPPRKFPDRVGGANILDCYVRWHDAYWTSNARPRTAYDPTISVQAPKSGSDDRDARPSVSERDRARERAAEDRTQPCEAAELPVEPPTFPPRHLRGSAAERRAAILKIASTVRMPTIVDIMMLTGWNYDMASRHVDDCMTRGLLDRIQPAAPRGKGSVPIVYILTSAGARELADRGGDLDDLQRIAKNSGVLRRAVDDRLATQWTHRRSTAALMTILSAAIARIDPVATISDVTFDRELVLPIDISRFVAEIPARDRTFISPDPTKTRLTYLPDAAFTIEWARPEAKRRRERVLLEIETGLGERDERDLAVGKAWKLRAFLADMPAEEHPRVVVWTPNAALEQRFFEGARSVFGEHRSPLWLTHGDFLPLGVPAGTKKKELPDAAAAVVANVQQRVWRWLRFPSPDDRRRFIAVERGQ